MGTYTFRWAHPAGEVHVTGTFDNWTKSVQLERNGDVFEKTVDIPHTSDKTLFKFFVDNNWTVDYGLACEDDGSGNVNNVLRPEEITPKPAVSSSEAHMPGSFPETPFEYPGSPEPTYSIQPLPATTGTRNPVDLAAGESVPHHSEYTSNTVDSSAKLDKDSYEKSDAYPGGAPVEDSTFEVAPIPATTGTGNPVDLTPGESVPHHSEYTSNTVDSSVKLDKDAYEQSDAYPGGAPAEESTFGVAPIPATTGFGNPISLAPGESVPHHSEYTSNTIGSNVKLDKDSYERSDAYPTDTSTQDTTASDFTLPPVSGTMIPESSLPMGSSSGIDDFSGPSIRSGGGATTTSDLAGQVSKEPRGVPSVVSESHEDAQQTDDYAGSSIRSGGGATTTSDLAGQVPKEPRGVPSVISESHSDAQQADDYSSPSIRSGGGATTTSDLAGQVSKEPRGVPSIVSDSHEDAQQTGEAAADPEVVAEKKDVEEELKSKVPEAPATSESGSYVGRYAAAGGAAVVGAAGAAAAWMPDSVRQAIADMNAGKNPLAGLTSGTGTSSTTTDVPEEVKSSYEQAKESPEAASNSEAVAEKTEVERELLSKVPTSEETGESAPTAATSHSTVAPTSAAITGGSTSHSTQDVPEEVKDSYEQANESPEAAANPEAVAEKSEVERELLSKVSTTQESGEPAPTATASSSAVAPSTDVTSTTAPMMMGATSGGFTSHSTSAVPEEVKESYEQANESPEATANPEAVEEKSQVERELLSKVPTSQESGEPAPSATTTSSSFAPTTGTSSANAFTSSTTTGGSTSQSTQAVPEGVTESYLQAYQSPEATANPEAVEEKAEVERELLSKVPTSQESGEPAPTVTAATSTSAPTSGTTSGAITGTATGAVTGAATGLTSHSTSGAISGTTTSNLTENVIDQGVISAPATTVVDRVFAAPVDDFNSTSTNTAATSTAPTYTSTTTGLNATAAAPAKSAVTESAATPATAEKVSAPTTTTATTGISTSTVPATSTSSTTPAATKASESTGTTSATGTGGKAMAQAMKQRQDSRDISPMGRAAAGGPSATDSKVKGWQPSSQTSDNSKSKPTTPSKPAAQVAATTAAATSSSSSPARGSPASSNKATDEKKKKRQSFFGKIKDKLKG